MTDPDTGGCRAVLSWSLFDFANSAFTTLIVTFVYSAYFTRALAPDPITGTTLWSRGVALTGISVALLSPVLGAVADRWACRKAMLALSTALCVGFTAGLYLPGPGQVGWALACFVAANIGFELGTVFYNAFLPHITPAERIGRVSGYGWSLGYVGGLLCLGVAFVGFVGGGQPWFGLSTGNGQNVRAVNLLVAAWFALFSLPMFLWVREPSPRSPRRDGTGSFRQLARTLGRLRDFPQILRLLVARLFYIDGLVTVFAFGGIYATGTFGFTLSEVVLFGVATSTAGGVGALLGGFLDDRLGARRTILFSIAGLIAAAVAAVVTHAVAVFWAAAVVLGLLAGPVQAASRSLMGRFVPRHMEAEFFGFYAFSGKATAFAGPLLLGVLTEAFDSQRAGISVVVVFLLTGGLLLRRVDEGEGRRAALEA